MNFMYTPPNTTGSLTAGTPIATAQTAGNLTFGALSTPTSAPAPSGQKFSLGFNTPSSTTASTFTLGATAAKPIATNLSFGFSKPTSLTTTSVTAQVLPTSSTSSSGFTLGTSATAPSAGFNSGESTTATGFTLGSTTNTTPAPTTGFTLGSTSASTGFTLPTTTASSSFALGTTTATTGFALTTTTTASTGFAVNPTTTTGFTLGATPTSTKSPALSVSVAPTTVTPTTGISLPVSSTAAVKPVLPNPSVSFVQLEENINKWTIELEEQEKVFMNQVSHINEWDRLLLANGEKIVSLNNNVEKVKLEQQQLDHELDFIVAQQRELEECLLPLEKEFSDITVSDPERDTTYRMAENLNTQLKQMSEDLKEVIEHINEKNKHQDTTDPIVQIGRILNAHMNSLQWVDQNTALIKQQLDQVTKLSEMHRRENDSTQNL